ncbi:MAG: ABC transporter permease subunit [Clostridiaceae bacterium]
MNAANNNLPDISADNGQVNCETKSFLTRTMGQLKHNKILWLMILPGIVWYVIFLYLPVYGIVIAFENYSPFRGLLAGPWVGFKWFIDYCQSIYFFRTLKNTLLLNIFYIIFAFPAPIILALMLNEIKSAKFKKISQTISYMPHFISTVVVVGIFVNFMSPSTGIVNTLLMKIGLKAIPFMTDPAWFRPMYILSGIWQGIGWGSIIYLAALSSIDPGLYEAATVDGASKLRQMWHISLTGIKETIVIMLLLQLGHLFSVGYEKIILMYNPLNYETSDVISSYVYRRGLADGSYSYATAVGLFQAVLSYILLLFVNRLSKRINEVSLW